MISDWNTYYSLKMSFKCMSFRSVTAETLYSRVVFQLNEIVLNETKELILYAKYVEQGK
jgi:hypothetical protein